MSFQSKYIKYKTKYINLLKKIHGGTNVESTQSKLYIDIYKFKLLNYPSHSTAKNVSFGTLSKTIDLNKGIVKSTSDITNSIEDSYYSVDYIKSDNISNKYYSDYLNYPAKSDLDNPKYKYTNEYIHKLIKIICKTINILQCRLKHALRKYNKVDQFNEITNDTGYITKINITNKHKVIVFGDNHGSYHTFFRSMLRLHLCCVIDLNTFKVNDNYIVIFLGDIVDRGNFSLEILIIIFKFIINNKPHKFIINRGNHEEMSITEQYGFLDEIKYKIPTEFQSIFNNIIKIFTFCSTAIILINTDSKKKYWLCHGLICNDANIDIFINNNDRIFILDKQQANNIRWSDTPEYNQNTLILNEDSTFNYNGRPQIGTKILSKYLSPVYFEFIIRGHEDRYSNAWLLSSTIHRMHMGIDYENTINNKFTIYKNATSQQLYNKDTSITTTDYKQLDGPVQTITNLSYPDIYNVLTISTNTDLKRPLTSDSYIVMRFDEKMLPNVTDTILNSQEIDTWLNSKN